MTLRADLEIRRGDFRLDANFSVPGAGVSGLFGPSGAGKTSVLRAIAGLDRHPGVVRLGGTVWQDAECFVPAHERAVGYVFQESSLFSHLDVRANLEFGLKRLPEAKRRVSLSRAIELLGLEKLLDRTPAGLSGGEARRVSIARALAVSPAILLLDEPLTGLDAARRSETLSYLDSLRRELEIPVLYVSHVHDEVARIADHLILLGEGIVQSTGPIDEMLTRLDLPLATGPDAESLLQGRVAGHDERYDLTFVDAAGCRFAVPHRELADGTPVRLRIAARDVSLTLQPATETSILNVLPATVEALANTGAAEVTVRLRIGEEVLLARITRKSADLLALESGKPVFAQAKSVAVLT